MNQATLIRLAREKAETTDSGLARLIGVNRQRISTWKGESQAIPDHHAVTLATIAELDPALVVATIHAQHADKRTATVWNEIARRSAHAATLLIAITFIGGSALPSSAIATEFWTQNGYYVKSHAALPSEAPGPRRRRAIPESGRSLDTEI